MTAYPERPRRSLDGCPGCGVIPGRPHLPGCPALEPVDEEHRHDTDQLRTAHTRLVDLDGSGRLYRVHDGPHATENRQGINTARLTTRETRCAFILDATISVSIFVIAVVFAIGTITIIRWIP